MAIEVGTSIGNYVVKSKIGEGGMGLVWLAEHPLIGKKVAIKVISAAYAKNPDAVSRFFTEAQAVNTIGHPNIVDITDFGQSPTGESYFVMEFLNGESLGQRLQKGGLDLRRALHVAAQAADALAASHGAGILHRDLKPDNIFLIARGGDPDFVKVLDFGLAKLTTGSDKVSHKTRTGSMMGTPYYMAPEQCAGKGDIDARADVYAMGVILFEMLTGRVPFPGEAYVEIIVQHMTQPAPRVRSLEPSCPEWLDELVDRCLAKDKAARVQSMAELGATLSQHLAEMPGGGALPRSTAAQTAALGSKPAFGSNPPEAGGVRQPISTMTMAAGEAGANEVPGGGGLGKKKGLIIGGAVAAVAAVVVAVVIGGGGGGGGSTSAAAEAPVVEPPKPAPDVAPKPEPDVAAKPEPPPAAAEVSIEIGGSPSGAQVTLADGTMVCASTPCVWKTAKSATPVVLTIAKVGYQPREVKVTPSKDQGIDKDLVAAKSSGGGGGGKSKPPGGSGKTKPPPGHGEIKPPPEPEGDGELLKPKF